MINKIKKISYKYFYLIVFISVTLSFLIEFEFVEFNFLSNIFSEIILFPLLSLLICMLFILKKKKALEEVFAFFLFPLFFSVVLQPLLYLFTTDSRTSQILQMLFLIPISNVVYTVISIKKNKIDRKSLGHLITSIQAILFVSTLIGFIIKNPFLFEGFFTKTKITEFELIGIHFGTKIPLSNAIEGITQTIFIPYLFSATIIKGWIEYMNFKDSFERINDK